MKVEDLIGILTVIQGALPGTEIEVDCGPDESDGRFSLDIVAYLDDDGEERWRLVKWIESECSKFYPHDYWLSIYE